MQTTIDISMNGKGIGSEIASYLKGISYREALDGEADTLEVTLQDKDGLFRGDWFPTRGMSIEITLFLEGYALPLGEFSIDEVEVTFPPSECKIKGTSIPPGSAIKSVERSRSWEKVTLSTIAFDIASGAGLLLYYETTEDPVIERAEQAEESDLKFLHKLCSDKGLALKLNDRKLIVFDIEKYEAAGAVATIKRAGIKRFSGRATLNEVYNACEVTYKHGRKGAKYSGRATSGGALSGLLGSGGKTLKINKKVSSDAEAARLAHKKLKEANRKETEVTLTTIGDFRLRAGATINLDGYGHFDGKYLIDKATHSDGSGGYETTVELTRC